MANRYVRWVPATGAILQVSFRVVVALTGQTVTVVDSSALPQEPVVGGEANPVGTHTFDGATFTAIVASVVEVRLARRVELQLLIRQQEQVAGLGLWAIEDAARALVYRRWVEGQVRAMEANANIDTAARWAKLHGEASIPGAFWYTHHSVAGWGAYRPADRSGWLWWSTMPGTDPNATDSYNGAVDADIVLDQSAAYDWVERLRAPWGLTDGT